MRSYESSHRLLNSTAIFFVALISVCLCPQVYPGLMVTAGLIHYVLNLLHVTVHIRDVCVFLAPVFSGLTAISTFLLTRELWNQGAGLLAACFIAIVPGYISRSVAGSFDNEGIAIFALQFTYYLWVCRSNLNREKVTFFYTCLCDSFVMFSAVAHLSEVVDSFFSKRRGLCSQESRALLSNLACLTS